MERFIDSILLEWKDKKRRKPLLIRGARQVGKTYSVTTLGNHHFETFVKIDFEINRDFHKVFDGDLNVNNLLLRLEAITGKRIISGTTLLFFDEIQACPRAFSSLCFFYEQMPQLHVIAVGSLLEFASVNISFPVEKLQLEWLRPMGFEEFLRVTGHEKLSANLPSLDEEEPVYQLIHKKIIEQLRYYFLVGGMPEAVNTFAETSSLTEVTRVHKSLCQSYILDLAKYRGRPERDCIEHIFEQIPHRIGKRVKYTSLYPEKRIEKIKESLHALELALLIQKISSTNPNELPLGANASFKKFKIIFLDIGLMQYLCGLPSFELIKNKNLLDIYQGAFAEQFVGQELLLAGGSENDRLYYWDRPKKGSSAEVDYLFVINSEIIPVEVKYGNPSRLKSINIFLKEHSRSKEGIVFYAGNIEIKRDYRLKFMPLYTRLQEKTL